MASGIGAFAQSSVDRVDGGHHIYTRIIYTRILEWLGARWPGGHVNLEVIDLHSMSLLSILCKLQVLHDDLKTCCHDIHQLLRVILIRKSNMLAKL